MNSCLKIFSDNIIIRNRFMTTFIYIPGGLEQVWACRHVCHDSASVLNYMEMFIKYDF